MEEAQDISRSPENYIQTKIQVCANQEKANKCALSATLEESYKTAQVSQEIQQATTAAKEKEEKKKEKEKTNAAQD